MASLSLILKNLGRNPLRNVITALGTIVLVAAFIMIWSVLSFLEEVTQDSGQGVKVIVHERWSVAGRMPFAYAETLSQGAATGPDDVRPLESMTWQVYAGTLDPLKPTSWAASSVVNEAASSRAEHAAWATAASDAPASSKGWF